MAGLIEVPIWPYDSGIDRKNRFGESSRETLLPKK